MYWRGVAVTEVMHVVRMTSLLQFMTYLVSSTRLHYVEYGVGQMSTMVLVNFSPEQGFYGRGTLFSPVFF